MTYVYERPPADWVCPVCGEGPDRCQAVSEGEMMYPSKPSETVLYSDLIEEPEVKAWINRLRRIRGRDAA